MNSWNYRLIRHIEPPNKEWYAIHEVYYEKDRPVTITDGPTRPAADSVEGLKADMQRMMEAFDKPFLDYDNF